MLYYTIFMRGELQQLKYTYIVHGGKRLSLTLTDLSRIPVAFMITDMLRSVQTYYTMRLGSLF